MTVGALIPCRTGSKGVPGKNFKDFNGKSLVQWTINAARKSGIFSKIIVSSDGGAGDVLLLPNDIEILDNNRPGEFADDSARIDPLIWHYAEEYKEVGMWCLLQPTSPLRTAGDIKAAYRMVKGEKYDSLVSVTPEPCMCWVDKAVGIKGTDYPIATYHPHKRPNRQERKDWYRENGAIYFTKRYVLEQTRCRLGGKIGLFTMPPQRSLEIDTPFDWFIAESVGAKWVG